MKTTYKGNCMRLLLFILISTLVFAYDVTLINHCKGLKVTKIELAKHNPYGDKEVVGIQYGLKNTTNKNIDDIKISVYLKDKDGHRVYEDYNAPKKLDNKFPNNLSTWIEYEEIKKEGKYHEQEMQKL